MNNIIIDSIFDADLQTIMNGIQYSTSTREIMTIGEMIKYHETKCEKGLKIDERV